MNRFPPIFIPRRPHTADEQVTYITYNLFKNGLLSEKQLMDPNTKASIELGKALHEEDEEFNKKVVPINIFEQRRMRKQFEEAQAKRENLAKSVARATDDFFMGGNKRKAELQKKIEEERKRRNLSVVKDYRLLKDPK